MYKFEYQSLGGNAEDMSNTDETLNVIIHPNHSQVAANIRVPEKHDLYYDRRLQKMIR
jgi:hypothetical protein